MLGRRRWGDEDSDDDELTVDAVRKARAAKASAGEQSLSQMQMQTKEVSKKALSSTQRSLKQLEQTTQMAGATLEKMHDQVTTLISPCHASRARPVLAAVQYHAGLSWSCDRDRDRACVAVTFPEAVLISSHRSRYHL